MGGDTTLEAIEMLSGVVLGWWVGTGSWGIRVAGAEVVGAKGREKVGGGQWW